MNVKQIRMLLVVIVVSFAVTGCSKEAQDSIYQNTMISGMFGYDETYNDTGMMNSERGIVYFCDPETGYRAPICTKINCSHEPRSLTNISPDCDAYFSEMINCTAIIGDTLYYMAIPDDKGLFIKEFCKAEKNGTNRKVIASFDNVEGPTYMAYEQGFFIYAYHNQDDPSGIPLEKYKAGIILVDLGTEEVKHIKLDEADHIQVGICSISDNYLYFHLTYRDGDAGYDYEDLTDPDKQDMIKNSIKMELWRYDLDTGEKSLIPDPAGYGFRTMGYDHILYQSDDLDGFMIKNIKDGTENFLLDNKAGSEGICLFSDGIVFSADNTFSFWENGTDKKEKIGIYQDDWISIYCITRKWVYGVIMNGEDSEHVCCPKDKFMKGDFEWKVIELG